LRLVHQPLIQSISAVLPFRRHTPAALAALSFSAMPKGMGCCRMLGLVSMRRGWAALRLPTANRLFRSCWPPGPRRVAQHPPGRCRTRSVVRTAAESCWSQPSGRSGGWSICGAT